MKLLSILVFGLFTLSVYAKHHDPCEEGDHSDDCQATEVAEQDARNDVSKGESGQEAASSISPWQGTWAGSENSPSGGAFPVRAKIKVTNGTISGTWNLHAGALKPITGKVEGKEASITILQGGGLIKATLEDENTFKYSGVRGFGTLSRQ